MRQRDKSHEWKCQPEKFLTPELERHEIITGSLSLAVVSMLTGTITWYAANDGTYLTVYYRVDDYGWIWFFLQIPIVFIYQVCPCQTIKILINNIKKLNEIRLFL